MGVLKVWNPTSQQYEPVAIGKTVEQATEGMHLVTSVTTSVPATTETKLQFTSGDVFKSTGTTLSFDPADDSIEVTESGWYHCYGYIFEVVQQNFYLRIRVDGNSRHLAMGTYLGSGTSWTGRFSSGGPIYLNAGEKVSVWAYNQVVRDFDNVNLVVVRIEGVKGDKGEQGIPGADAPDTYAELLDVNMAGLITDDIPRWDGAAWKPGKAADPSGSTSLAWPVGSVYFSATTDDPAVALGFGTWSHISDGRFIMGAVEAQAAEAEGGAETHDHTYSTAISHTHGVSDPSHAHGVSDPAHSHTQTTASAAGATNRSAKSVQTGQQNSSNSTAAAATGIGIHGAYTGISIQSAGSASGTTSAKDHKPPYLTLHAWKRTA